MRLSRTREAVRCGSRMSLLTEPWQDSARTPMQQAGEGWGGGCGRVFRCLARLGVPGGRSSRHRPGTGLRRLHGEPLNPDLPSSPWCPRPYSRTPFPAVSPSNPRAAPEFRLKPWDWTGLSASPPEGELRSLSVSICPWAAVALRGLGTDRASPPLAGTEGAGRAPTRRPRRPRSL